MDTNAPPYVPSAESQQALEQNVYASAAHAQLQTQALQQIAADLRVIKWAAVLAALLLLLLVLR